MFAAGEGRLSIRRVESPTGGKEKRLLEASFLRLLAKRNDDDDEEDDEVCGGGTAVLLNLESVF